MSKTPAFLQLSLAEQRSKFLKISQTCDEHLDEAYGKVDSEWDMLEGLAKVNAPRNRYSNVFPFDKTRVILPILPGGQSDYINASHISLGGGFNYIAAQGPLVNTIPHFWAMAFHEAELQKTDTVVVAMMTPLKEGGREKCSRYWPDANHPTWDFTETLRSEGISPGELKITWKSSERIHNGDLILSQFTLTSPTTTKKVLHFFFQKWEDNRVPESMDPILALSLEIRKITEKDPLIAPIVHCSAGVGRTGTYISIDYLLNGPSFSASDVEDPVFDVTTKLRSQRMMMVQTVYQYMFLYGVAKRLYEEKKASQ